MSRVNLLPMEVRRWQAVRRQGRAWGVVLVCAAGLASVPAVLNASKQARTAALSERRAAVERERDELKAQGAAAARRLEDLQGQVVRADALRTKRKWSGLLSLIGGCIPREVWLTGVATDPAVPSAGRPAAAGPAGGPKPDTRVRLAAPTKLVLHGYALNHDPLYAFMVRLKETGVFEEVGLVRSEREPVLGGEAVRFSLQCNW